MDGYWWGPHFFGWMWVFPALFMLVCFLFVFSCVFRGRMPWSRPDRGRGRETPREILDRRYAGGEVTTEQYEQMRRTLEAHAPAGR
jgi:putative membrane protein